jgi:CRISPR-associated endonuclease Csy4
MDSYFDIKALPNPEIIQSAVVAHLMQALHSELPEFEGRVGLDFPAYGQQRTLGGIIRVLGFSADINQLHRRLEQNVSFTDYALLTSISDIPENVGKYAKYLRCHAKGNSRLVRLKKRHEAKGTWTDELQLAVSDKFSQLIKLPYVQLTSASTGQPFMLFIRQKIMTDAEVGSFNGYGLSLGEATIPKF